MRTTLNIDEDVLLAVQAQARSQRRSAGAVLSDLARQALTGQHQGSAFSGQERHGFRPLPHRGSPVTNTLINELREAEAE